MSMVLNQIQMDARGSINQLVLPENRELMVFFCKAGYLRGGHSHNCEEMVILLSGRIRYHRWFPDGEIVETLEAGNTTYNPAGVPHMAEFLMDSWVLDWKLGDPEKVGIGKFTTFDFEPFRKLVRERMAQ